MKNFGKYVWGIAFIILGLLLLGKSFDLLEFNIFFKGWWTLFIIVPATIDLFTKEEKLNTAMFLVLGIALLCAANDLIDYGDVFKIFLCLGLILVGIKIMFNKSAKVKQPKDLPTYAGVFGSSEEKCTKNYKGGSAVAIFGGVDLDLSEVVLKEDIRLETLCLFGSITIKTNDNIEIVSSTFNVFGGTENKAKKTSKTYKVYVEGFCMFGGIEIK